MAHNHQLAGSEPNRATQLGANIYAEDYFLLARINRKRKPGPKDISESPDFGNGASTL